MVYLLLFAPLPGGYEGFLNQRFALFGAPDQGLVVLGSHLLGVVALGGKVSATFPPRAASKKN